MLPEEFESLFARKPYLRLYFQNLKIGNNSYQCLEAKQKGEFYLSKNGKALTSTISPKRAAERLIGSLHSNNTVTILYGLGNPETIKILNETLEPGKILILIDDSLEVIAPLQEKFLLPALSIPGRHLFCGEGSISILFNYLESLPIERLTKIKTLREPGSISLNKSFYDSIEEKISKVFSSKMSDLLTKFEFERIWVKNSIINSLNFFNTKVPRYKIIDLVDKFHEIPAILVSAGPSLRSQCNFIQRNRDKFFVISCDTSLKVLYKYNIMPDAVMTLDAQTHSYFHFMGEKIQCPLFADMVASPPLLRSISLTSIIHSLTAKFQVDASGNPIREVTAGGDIAEELLGRIGEVQSGGSVATSAFDALRVMGFGPIFLVGQDLAYTGREIHSTGTHHNEKWLTMITRKKSLETINEIIIRKRDTKMIPSSNGENVISDYVLGIYKQWFEDSVKNVGFSIYNISTQGSKLEGIPSISLEEANSISENFKNHNYPWKELPPWNRSSTLIEDEFDRIQMKNKFISEIDNILLQINSEEEINYDNALEILKESKDYVARLLRKTLIYLKRHETELDEKRKSEIIVNSLKKELKFLKRGLFSSVI